MNTIIVALYDDVALAQGAVYALLAEGLPRADVSMLSNETIAAIVGAAEGGGEAGPLGEAEVSGGDLVPRLVGLGVDRGAAEGYAEGLRRGGALVVVRTAEAHAPKACEILDNAGALDHQAQVESWRREGWSGYDPNAAAFTGAEADAERRRRAARLSRRDEDVPGERVDRIVRRATVYFAPD